MNTPSVEELQAQIAALQQQLTALKSGYTAHELGSGAIAQGPGAVAAGQGGIAAKEIYGNVYMGPAIHDPVLALEIYRRVFASGYRHLPMRGIDVGASDPVSGDKRIELEQVYIALDTTDRAKPELASGALTSKKVLVEELLVPTDNQSDGQSRSTLENQDSAKASPLSALTAVTVFRRVVLLGDPGSGKSTFLSHLGLCLALNYLEPGAGWLARLPGWPLKDADLLPIHVVLRDLVRTLPRDCEQVTPQHLWLYIQERLRSQNLHFAIEPLHERLELGAAILLLDGLDEIPTQAQRSLVHAVVAIFAKRYPDCRLVITCRTLAYQDPAIQFNGIPSFELAPLNRHKIDSFIQAWYTQLGQLGILDSEVADSLAVRLSNSIRQPDLWRMAPNPLLLTVMALVHTHKGRLPDARALLYEETVEILLWRWEQIKSERDSTVPVLRQLLQGANRTDVDLKLVLWKLAFDAHKAGAADATDTLADIGALQLQRALADLHPAKSLDFAAQVIEAIKLRAGLLVERLPDVFTFPHRTFQEYLAGSYLTVRPDFALQCAKLLEEPTLWREVVLLAVNRLVYLSGDTDKPLALVAELCPHQPINSPVAWKKAWLAGQVLEEIGLNRVQDRELGVDLLGRVRMRLVDLLRVGSLAPRERASASDLLERLGDPRFRPDAWNLPNEPLLGFIEIPAGPFIMGSNIRSNSMRRNIRKIRKQYLEATNVEVLVDESPQHEVHLQSFFIGRYPVTAAQYQVFLQATSMVENRHDASSQHMGTGHRPVRNITMWEAIAYCDWLTEQLRNWSYTPQPLATLLHNTIDARSQWCVTLPTEAQWEKAVRGDDGRVYPWGNQYNSSLAGINNYEISIGCCPAGESPYGCEDMFGIWNWTRTLYRSGSELGPFNYPYDISDGREGWESFIQRDSVDSYVVLRGSNPGHVGDVQAIVNRCSSRSPEKPDAVYSDVGFRVVIACVSGSQNMELIIPHDHQDDE